MITKNDLRKFAKEKRKLLDIPEISAKICDEIDCSDFFHKVTNIMIFYPLKYEIDLTSLLTHNKNFFLPRVNGKELDICEYSLGDELEFSQFKTLEPKTKAITNLKMLDVIFIPALAVDINKYRLGYGGGFYDRLLAKIPDNVRKIAVIPSELIIENVPHEEFDQKVDYIISEKQTI